MAVVCHTCILIIFHPTWMNAFGLISLWENLPYMDPTKWQIFICLWCQLPGDQSHPGLLPSSTTCRVANPMKPEIAKPMCFSNACGEAWNQLSRSSDWTWSDSATSTFVTSIWSTPLLVQSAKWYTEPAFRFTQTQTHTHIYINIQHSHYFSLLAVKWLVKNHNYGHRRVGEGWISWIPRFNHGPRVWQDQQ